LKNLFVVVGIGALAYWLLTSVSNHVSANLSIVKANFSLGSFSVTGVPITVQIHVRNNTRLAIPLDSFTGILSDSSNELAPVNINHATIIEPDKITIITIDTFLNYLKVGSAVIDRFKSGAYLRGLRLKGWMTVKGIDIPVDQDINPFTA
jgi:hypothetical protein